MSIINFFDLVCNSLPKGFNTTQLKQLAKPEWWEHNPMAACTYVLQKSGSINWDAYIANNPDVRSACIHPVLHFLKYGVFEGRKLYVWPESTPVIASRGILAERPKVSVVVPIYNDELYLKMSIGSLIVQTLKEIEIIIIDNASTDTSPKIIQSFAEADSRIKFLEFDHNKSRHMARKAGVAAANGQYIMFLNATDTFAPTACAQAFATAAKGYDITCFNFSVYTPQRMDITMKAKYDKYFNRCETGIFRGYEVMEEIYANNWISDLLWDKIYDSKICKTAFLKMDDGFFDYDEDIYEACVLTSQARTFYKIKDHLYTHRLYPNTEISVNKRYPTLYTENVGQIWPSLHAYLNTSGLNNYNEPLSERILTEAIKAWLEQESPEQITVNFNAMAENFGIVRLISFLADRYSQNWKKVSDVFHHYISTSGKKLEGTCSIGFLYEEFANGGTERVILDMAKMLLKRGYQITLFLERPHENDQLLPTDIKVVYVPVPYCSDNLIKSNLYALDTAIKQNRVEIMFCPACWNNKLLWQIMLLKYRGLYVFIHNHMAFFDPLLSTEQAYSIQNHDSVLRCADKTICLSRYSELYYHIHGINAQYIPNPIQFEEVPVEDFENRRNNIVIFGRIGDPTKRVEDSLRAIAEIVKEMPQIKATFIGPLRTLGERWQFFNLVRELELEENVCVTGWTNKPLPFVAHAAILISTAYQEAFPLTICQAQMLGLPCVMYNLPIMPAEDNPSIIRVTHGDYKAVAKEVIALLSDESRWRMLSAIAVENVRKFSPEIFIKQLIDLINNFKKKSNISYYTPEEYRTVMRTLAFYAADLPPWREK